MTTFGGLQLSGGCYFEIHVVDWTPQGSLCSSQVEQGQELVNELINIGFTLATSFWDLTVTFGLQILCSGESGDWSVFTCTSDPPCRNKCTVFSVRKWLQSACLKKKERQKREIKDHLMKIYNESHIMSTGATRVNSLFTVGGRGQGGQNLRPPIPCSPTSHTFISHLPPFLCCSRPL